MTRTDECEVAEVPGSLTNAVHWRRQEVVSQHRCEFLLR